MARTFWKDRIGEEKTVEEFTFIIVNNIDVKNIEVEVNGEKIIVPKDVWNRGVFSKQIKSLRGNAKQKKKSNKAPRISKYVGQQKTINNVIFYVVSYAKNKVDVKAKGYRGSKSMCVRTWNNEKFYDNMMKVLEKIFDLLIHPDWERYYKQEQVFKQTEYKNDFSDFHLCSSKEETKALYRKLAKIYHPDMGGTQELFETLVTCYESEMAVWRAWDELGFEM